MALPVAAKILLMFADTDSKKKNNLLLIVILIPLLLSLLILPILQGYKNETSIGDKANVSEEVEQYTEQILKALEAEALDAKWVNVIKAIMMQESRGLGLDPMQSSESPYNTKYPNKPGAIQDPGYSIACGVQHFKECLVLAVCQSPEELSALYLALQGYNYGTGYISWAQLRGGYTQENAQEFSDMKKSQLGWSVYGDPEYVPHVMQFYSTGNDSSGAGGTEVLPEGSGGFAMPLKPGSYHVSQPYKGAAHWGVDLGAAEGTPIYAAASGTVYFAGWGYPGQGFGGYGNGILIDHGNGYYTMYGHCSQLFVSAGQTVAKGQQIGAVGNTGNSFGNHLHFEIRTGIQYPRINPQSFLDF